MELLVNETIGQFRRAGAAVMGMQKRRGGQCVAASLAALSLSESISDPGDRLRGKAAAGLRALDELVGRLREQLGALQAEWRPLLCDGVPDVADNPSHEQAEVDGEELAGCADDTSSCGIEVDALLEEMVTEVEQAVSQAEMGGACNDGPDVYPLLDQILRMDAGRGWTPTTRVARERMQHIWSAVVNEIGGTVLEPAEPQLSLGSMETANVRSHASDAIWASPMYQPGSCNRPHKLVGTALAGNGYPHDVGTPPATSCPSEKSPLFLNASTCSACKREPCQSEYCDTSDRGCQVAVAEIIRLQRQVDYLTDQLQRVETQLASGKTSKSSSFCDQRELEKQRLALQVEVEQCRVGRQSLDSDQLIGSAPTSITENSAVTKARTPVSTYGATSSFGSHSARHSRQGFPTASSSNSQPRFHTPGSINRSAEPRNTAPSDYWAFESAAGASQDGRVTDFTPPPVVPLSGSPAHVHRHCGDQHLQQRASPSLSSWNSENVDAGISPEALERICQPTPAFAGLLPPRYQDSSASETISPCNTTVDTQHTDHSIEIPDTGSFKPRVSLPAMTELIIGQNRAQGIAGERKVRRSSPTLGGMHRLVPPPAQRGILHPRANTIGNRGMPRKAAKSERRSLAREIADEFQVFSKEAVPESFRAMYCKALLQAEKENQKH